MRFPNRIISGQLVEMDWDRFRQFVRTRPDGDYELIYRKKVEWDTEQMRKYFHGPVLKFIQNELKKQKKIYGKEKIKKMLKDELGPREHVQIGKRKVWDVKSTGDYSFNEYRDFLNDLNHWCIDCFEIGLPPADEEDLE